MGAGWEDDFRKCAEGALEGLKDAPRDLATPHYLAVGFLPRKKA
jgi:hypothetical protein